MTLLKNGALPVQLEAVDPDAAEGVDTLTYTLRLNPAHGTLEGFSPTAGAVTYRPAPDYTGNDLFAFAVSDGTATSLQTDVAVYVMGGWLVTLGVTDAGVPSVQFGVEPEATADYDLRFDRTVPPAPAEGVGSVAFIDVTRAWPDDLARDVRGTPEGTNWLLEVAPAAAPVVLSWDSASLPIPLRLYQVAGPDPTGAPLAGTSVDMSTTSQLTVSGAAPQYFVITQAYQTFALHLELGWNLISLPIAPENTAVGLVLSATASRENAPAQELRDGKRGVVFSGDVWQWDTAAQPPQYVEAADLHALTGYWFFAPNDTTWEFGR